LSVPSAQWINDWLPELFVREYNGAMTRTSKWGGPIAVGAILIVLTACYVGCYFWLSTPVRSIQGGPGLADRHIITRFYAYWWLREIFRPGSHVEGWVRGIDTDAMSMDDNPLRPVVGH
jgi:hypothetical protein